MLASPLKVHRMGNHFSLENFDADFCFGFFIRIFASTSYLPQANHIFDLAVMHIATQYDLLPIQEYKGDRDGSFDLNRQKPELAR